MFDEKKCRTFGHRLTYIILSDDTITGVSRHYLAFIATLDGSVALVPS